MAHLYWSHISGPHCNCINNPTVNFRGPSFHNINERLWAYFSIWSKEYSGSKTICTKMCKDCPILVFTCNWRLHLGSLNTWKKWRNYNKYLFVIILSRKRLLTTIMWKNCCQEKAHINTQTLGTDTYDTWHILHYLSSYLSSLRNCKVAES